MKLNKLQAQNLDELLKLCVDYIRQRRTKCFVGWNMCFYPVIFPSDPTTIREVLTATNVPKNNGVTGSYRMIRPWIGKLYCKVSYCHIGIYLAKIMTTAVTFKTVFLIKKNENKN